MLILSFSDHGTRNTQDNDNKRQDLGEIKPRLNKKTSSILTLIPAAVQKRRHTKTSKGQAKKIKKKQGDSQGGSGCWDGLYGWQLKWQSRMKCVTVLQMTMKGDSLSFIRLGQDRGNCHPTVIGLIGSLCKSLLRVSNHTLSWYMSSPVSTLVIAVVCLVSLSLRSWCNSVGVWWWWWAFIVQKLRLQTNWFEFGFDHGTLQNNTKRHWKFVNHDERQGNRLIRMYT